MKRTRTCPAERKEEALWPVSCSIISGRATSLKDPHITQSHRAQESKKTLSEVETAGWSSRQNTRMETRLLWMDYWLIIQNFGLADENGWSKFLISTRSASSCMCCTSPCTKSRLKSRRAHDDPGPDANASGDGKHIRQDEVSVRNETQSLFYD